MDTLSILFLQNVLLNWTLCLFKILIKLILEIIRIIKLMIEMLISIDWVEWILVILLINYRKFDIRYFLNLNRNILHLWWENLYVVMILIVNSLFLIIIIIIVDNTACSLYLNASFSSCNYGFIIFILLFLWIFYISIRVTLISGRVYILWVLSSVISRSFPTSHLLTDIFYRSRSYIYIFHYLMKIFVFVFVNLLLRNLINRF